MLTYVINTSENRTFDSDRLFDLAGYNKIRWMNCSLSQVRQCAEFISEKQNVLGAEQFRIAVIVDFFGFDRVRTPYGRQGYHPEIGVDISIYMPFIEVFLLDNLITYLENKELRSSDFEIYYIQNEKLERYEFIDNALEQTAQVLSGSGEGEEMPEDAKKALIDKIERRKQTERELAMLEKEKEQYGRELFDGDDANGIDDDLYGESDDTKADEKEDGISENFILYKSFDLYCTKNVTLNIDLANYPYGAEKMTFLQFFNAFSTRSAQKNLIRRHFYVSNYGGGRARAAFDTLSLSLYLIKMYEREEMVPDDGELEIAHIDAGLLRDELVTAWSKIHLAKEAATGNNSVYYSLKDNMRIDKEGLEFKENIRPEVLPDVADSGVGKMSSKDLFGKICHYHDRTPEELASDNRAEFDNIITDYLKGRDETREASVKAELELRMREGEMVTTQQFPSKEEYLFLVKQKEDEISSRFEKALNAKYISVDYTEEKERAEKVYDDYKKAKDFLKFNIIGDVIFFVLAILSFMIPYAALQLSSFKVSKMAEFFLSVNTCAFFGAMFILGVVIQIIVFTTKLSRAKTELRGLYTDCYIKERYSMSQIRSRYDSDLIYIERTRYEIRQLKYLYEANVAKDANIKRHRDMLEEVEDRLSGILNNLDVIPTLDPEESIYGEFDISKPIRARENKVYKVFSIDTIEKFFPKKGSDRR